ncbi:hypothetical protein, partial [Specibacter sp. RAF43]|uniref:hypothetical protein n=1 Tax=Specibacter sp. RAF43 TaxID=3233057 RepID=UPI003F98C8D4
QYMNVFFGGAGLSPEMYARWRAWTRDYERVWIGVVGRAMDAGVIPVDDPVISARLMLGMINWVSRWYRPSDGYTAEAIAEVAVRLISQSTTRPA